MFTLISAGVAPGIALLSYFYLKDEYETEPLSFVLRIFIIGALLVFPIMFIQYVFHAEGMATSKVARAFFCQDCWRSSSSGLSFIFLFMTIMNLTSRTTALCIAPVCRSGLRRWKIFCIYWRTVWSLL